MEELEQLWRDEHDEGVPFRSNTNVTAVAQIVSKLTKEGILDDTTKQKILQWTRWHWFVNSNKSDADTLLKQLQQIIIQLHNARGGN